MHDSLRPVEVVRVRDAATAIAETPPLVVLDLNAPCSAGELEDATHAVARSPVPVVGRLHSAVPGGINGLLEVLTTTLGTSSRGPWVVEVSDLDVALALIDQRVRACPTAAATLAGLLRVTSLLPMTEALVAESLAYSMLLAGPEFARWRASRQVNTMQTDDSPAVLIDRVGDDLHLTLSRPRRHNAFSREVRDALLEGLAVAKADSTVEVHLQGAGPSFCSGGDLDEFGTVTDVTAAHLVRVRLSAGHALHDLATRVTAHLHGACIGAGIEIPAFAGRVVAAVDSRFQLPELGMGLVPGAGGTVSIPRRIGRWRTAWWVLSGITLDAPTALAWGLVDELN